MKVVKEKAYAKINLYLDVLSKREDGFHDIKTVMHSVSLFDELTVSVAPSSKRSVSLVISDASHLPSDSKNLAYAAAMLFLEKLGVNDKVDIKLKKKIPISAGLAGGSSDAAAVLRALNKLYKRPFTQKALMSIGAELGSDIPYCIVGKTALCEGRGEKIARISTNTSLNIVVASSKERVSTPEAYGDLDKRYSDFNGSVFKDSEKYYIKLVEELKNFGIVKDGLYNIFETVVLEKCQGAKRIKDELLKLGAVSSMMSGSGPSVFAVFKTKEDAEAAKVSLLAQGYIAWCVESV